MYYLEYIQKLIVAKLSSIDFSWKDELTDYTIKNKDIILNFNYNEKIILKNFTNLNHKEKEKIRLYRNHFEIKKYLYHTHYISKYEHKNFISNLRKTTQKSYYCVIYNNKILGSVNFRKKLNNIIEFGFYANPFSKILGLGRILEHISIFYAFKIQNCDILQLEVFEDNMQIIGLHKIFNFETTSSFTFQNKSVLKMQLNNPNRDIVS
ncbi:UDP-4-amino-4,6-dideoxy-N-acetyl-beta-L-altrosamine N-acetyltransferase [Campylobacter volucris]|nr:UDP-4-amino-4,6-dideoxy-N-acetyl-beta-L-altrosamine N-acetyltransferase [Campylobacter volucris]